MFVRFIKAAIGAVFAVLALVPTASFGQQFWYAPPYLPPAGITDYVSNISGTQVFATREDAEANSM